MAKKLKKEIEIAQIIQKIRVVEAAVKTNFTLDEWREFKSKYATRKLHMVKETKENIFKDDPDEEDKQESGANPLAGGIFSKFGG